MLLTLLIAFPSEPFIRLKTMIRDEYRDGGVTVFFGPPIT